ncbi:Recombinase [Sphingobium yanoikuyae]|jgi:DNA invertase Pin-like site-specific DNA recombinase|uniref:Recombinase n=1 Tax=Sphingobium yanoikuyae TaxID=13690 RepID=A0A084ETP0_SPHYA|nr:recombinase family protein [Sphingobium yanoikuyae]KEZ21332.1 Recombinase [Sphingobium yanoikuyae]
MLESWSADLSQEAAPPIKAAEYVRMSTDHQKYSTENQADAIRSYAQRRNMEIVRTYADEGKSGLSIHGRDALQQIIEDVTAGNPGFSVILVYDVSRWGRFQDADESAYYEYICRRAGIDVHYCAEQFENDGSPVATMAKGFKRWMAGEYSRELSTKVFVGQCRLIELGFRQGGPAGFGLRRTLVDQNGAEKGALARGEHKSIQTDRVVLSPGPDQEVAVVRRIYSSFVVDRLTEREIADQLNKSGICTDMGKPWTRGTVHQILINEKYIGNNVWNRVSNKLKKKRVRNDPAMWIRAERAFTPIVDPGLHNAAQIIIRERSARLSDEEMLGALTGLLKSHGLLSGIIIDESEGLPSSSSYRSRFGSLLRAYSLVGYQPMRDYQYVEINRQLRALYPDVIDKVIDGFNAIGAEIEKSDDDLLMVNGQFSISVVIVRCQRTPAGSARWKVRFDTSLAPDITVAIRMDPTNRTASDYYIFPRLDRLGSALRLAEENVFMLDAYRFDSLDLLFRLGEQYNLLEAA